MSIAVMSQVWKDGPQKQAEILVLLALADFCDDDGLCWPAVATIAKKARMSERNARRILRQLEADNWIWVEATTGGHGVTARYHIRPIATSNPDNLSDNAKTRTNVQTRTNGAQNPDKFDRNPDTAMSGEPYNHQESSSTPLTPLQILSGVLRPKTARDFIAHRKAMKKPVTPEAAERMVAKVAGHPDPDSVFDESIANGWQGIFPKQNDKGAKDGSAAERARRAGERFASRNLDRGPGGNTTFALLPTGQSGRGDGGCG